MRKGHPKPPLPRHPVPIKSGSGSSECVLFDERSERAEYFFTMTGYSRDVLSEAKTHIRLTTLSILFVGLIFLFAQTIHHAQAQSMLSPSYEIQMGNFNMTSGEKASNTYNVTDTVGQTGAGLFGSLGGSTYVVGSGFQYIYPFNEFSFQISTLDIDLGTLNINSHNTANHTLTVTSPGANGYQVYAYQAHPLQTLGGVNFIPDTSCDGGTCTEVESTAAVWTNTAIPGFGFNASGDDVTSDFATSNYYRQFANQATSEAMQVIMRRNSQGSGRVATITYKAGISGTQAAGTYQTNVSFVAVPSY